MKSHIQTIFAPLLDDAKLYRRLFRSLEDSSQQVSDNSEENISTVETISEEEAPKEEVQAPEGLEEKIILAAMIGASALLAFILIPSYPIGVGIALAILLAGTSLKTRATAVFALLFLVGVALAYQFGALIGHMAGVYVLILYLAIALLAYRSCHTFSGAIGTLLGVIAAVLMLTPAYIISVPLIIFFVTTYRKMGKRTFIATYLIFYIPLQILGQIPLTLALDSMPLLYVQVTPNFYEAAPVLNLDYLVGRIVNAGTLPDVDPLNSEKFVYWLIYYFVGSFSITAIVIIISSAISVAFMFEDFVAYLEKKGYEFRHYNLIVPFLSNMVGCIVFAAPLAGLADALRYATALQEALPLYLLLSLAGASAASVTNMYLARRALMISLRQEIREEAERLENFLMEEEKQMAELKRVLKSIRVEDLSARIEEIKRELSLTLDTLNILNVKALQDRRAGIREYFDLSESISSQLRSRAFSDHLSITSKFSEIFNRAEELGLSVPEISKISQDELAELDLNSVIQTYQSLEGSIEESLRKMIDLGVKIGDIVKQNFDPQFESTGFEIARSFYDKRDFVRALETAIDNFELIEGKYSRKISSTATVLRRHSSTLLNKVFTRIYSLLDEAGENDLKNRLAKDVEDLKPEYFEASKVAELVTLVEGKEKLVNILVHTLKVIDSRLEAIEKEIDVKTPRGYSWAKNDQIHEIVERSSRELKEKSVRLNKQLYDVLSKTFKVLKEEVDILERYLLEAEFVRNYPNIDSFLTSKLLKNGIVEAEEFPFSFGQKYMMLYSAYHKDTIYDNVKQVLIYKGVKRG